jgi:UDP-2,3-diacylglucosamine pyrophosphatase LpxH
MTHFSSDQMKAAPTVFIKKKSRQKVLLLISGHFHEARLKLLCPTGMQNQDI